QGGVRAVDQRIRIDLVVDDGEVADRRVAGIGHLVVVGDGLRTGDGDRLTALFVGVVNGLDDCKTRLALDRFARAVGLVDHTFVRDLDAVLDGGSGVDVVLGQRVPSRQLNNVYAWRRWDRGDCLGIGIEGL